MSAIGWIVIAVVEWVALAIGLLLWHFGKVPLLVGILFVLIPPVLTVVAGVLGLMKAESDGENPFQ